MAKHLNDTREDSAMAKCPHCGTVFDVSFTCNRCSHTWTPRENGEPAVCPKCKSPYWNKARVRVAKPVEVKSRAKK
jgi:DNA-directed RNA polymerase subunit RPC12/RpoP